MVRDPTPDHVCRQVRLCHDDGRASGLPGAPALGIAHAAQGGHVPAAGLDEAFDLLRIEGEDEPVVHRGHGGRRPGEQAEHGDARFAIGTGERDFDDACAQVAALLDEEPRFAFAFVDPFDDAEDLRGPSPGSCHGPPWGCRT